MRESGTQIAIDENKLKKGNQRPSTTHNIIDRHNDQHLRVAASDVDFKFGTDGSPSAFFVMQKSESEVRKTKARIRLFAGV